MCLCLLMGLRIYVHPLYEQDCGINPYKVQASCVYFDNLFIIIVLVKQYSWQFCVQL